MVGIDDVYKKEFFNLRASDKISLWRTVPDVRETEYAMRGLILSNFCLFFLNKYVLEII